MRRLLAALLVLGITNGCGQIAATPESRELSGFDDVKFGSSFDELMAAANASLFATIGLNECRVDMPINGCHLFAADNQSVFQTIEGIPYALEVEFNKFGQLTDLKLKFERSREYDSDLNPIKASITEAQCRDIGDRTVDWATAKYGILTLQPKPNDAKEIKTAKGNPYWIEDNPKASGFLASGSLKFNQEREIRLFSFFMKDGDEPYCVVSLDFRDSPKVLRRNSDEALRKSEARVAEVMDSL